MEAEAATKPKVQIADVSDLLEESEALCSWPEDPVRMGFMDYTSSVNWSDSVPEEVSEAATANSSSVCLDQSHGRRILRATCAILL